MTYIIVTQKQTIIGQPFASFASAISAASRIFGDDPVAWIDRNAVKVSLPGKGRHGRLVGRKHEARR